MQATRPTPAQELASRSGARSASTARRRLLADRAARWVVTAGGLAIIASILGILIFIVVEVVPLTAGAEVLRTGIWAWSGAETPPTAFLVDEHRSRLVHLDRAGRLVIRDASDGAIVETKELLDGGGAPVLGPSRSVAGQPLLYAQASDGRVVAVRVDWDVAFDEAGTRIVRAVPAEPVWFDFGFGEEDPVRALGLQIGDSGEAVGVAASEARRVVLLRRSVQENLFSGERTERWSRDEGVLPYEVDRVIVDSTLGNAFAAGRDGRLAWWSLAHDRPGEPQWTPQGTDVTALSFLIGDRSLVVGRTDGSLEIWFPVRLVDGERPRLTHVRTFEPFESAVAAIAPSMRDKGFAAASADGALGLFHSTSERTLWRRDGERPARSLFFAPKADGLYAADATGVVVYDVDNPHPEVSWGTLFGKVWYENYPEPAYVWQSSGGDDDFEPKLSLVPLMVGTLKGTLYSLLLAIPLGVFGAMYTSQFMHPTWKRYVKPTVEVMASLPSVVLGFLAGLWLAPRVEQQLPALAAALILLPLAVLAAGLAWRAVPNRIRGRFRPGSEIVLYVAAVSAALALSIGLNDALERVFFGGSARDWLSNVTGLPYDQRNALVVGLAMGFAVIPIIFSIAEDAFSNVPNNLISGSLALGANRWQTVTRVVLPTASPGIFSATMIGFGRAVGETMIVLMATGNTPVLDWHPFNGFRTLSANIAVEIPEAPQGGTLYRTLFLAAILLFLFTFVINTVAELVRQRLRKRYAEL